MNCLCTLRRKCRCHPKPHNLTKLNICESDLKRRITAAKTSFEMNLIQNFSQRSNSKIYKYISYVSGHGYSTNNQSWVLYCNLKKILYSTCISILFSPKALFLLPQTDMLPLPQSILSDVSIYTALASLDLQKCMGIDGISPRVLKWCALALHKPFHHLFPLTFSQTHLPEEWRTRLITPIHKSGDKSTIKNYRSIPLLCSIPKVLEKIIYDKIIGFVMDHVNSA